MKILNETDFSVSEYIGSYGMIKKGVYGSCKYNGILAIVSRTVYFCIKRLTWREEANKSIWLRLISTNYRGYSS